MVRQLSNLRIKKRILEASSKSVAIFLVISALLVEFLLWTVSRTDYIILLIIPFSILPFFLLSLKIRSLEYKVISKITDKTDSDFHQLESLLAVYSSLHIDHPLPATREWAASPDFLRTIVEIIFKYKPRIVMEMSSGVSTLIAAYALKKNGAGCLISLEHDKKYFDKTKMAITDRKLDSVARVIYAPLENMIINNSEYSWYNCSQLRIDMPIDFMIIDGPPGNIGRNARFPAIPVFSNRLSPEAIVLLDDGKRPDESETVLQWEKEYPDLHSEYLPFLEKGAFILKRSNR